MSYQLKRESVCEGVNFSSVTDPKFKHNRITVNLVTALDEKTVSGNAIVPFLLRKGCRNCPDFTQFNQRLCALYGAVLSCDISKYGGNQVLELSVYGIDDRFTLGGEKMVAECAQLLTEVLLDPNFKNGLFPPQDVALEKQQVIDAIESLINEKRAYAFSRCKSIMCEGEALAIEKYGTIASAKALNTEKATAAYHALIETAQIEIIFVGCGNPDTAKAIFSKAFCDISRKPSTLLMADTPAKAERIKEITDKMDVAQGKLVLGFRTGVTHHAQDMMAMRMMAALYGGTPSSRLFHYVREKLSLCYYCAARYDRMTGLLFVDSGVEIQNKQKAQDEILNQLEQIKNNAFTDEEFTATRLLMQNALNTVTDSLGAMEDWYMTQILCGTDMAPAKESELLEAVTREEVVAAAKKVSLDTVYFLTGKEAQE